MDTTAALNECETLIHQFSGYIKAACSGHPEADRDDVAQSLRLFAIEVPESFALADAGAKRVIVEEAIRAARCSRHAGNGRPSVADLFNRLPDSLRATIRSEVLASGSQDLKRIREYVSKRIRELTTIGV